LGGRPLWQSLASGHVADVAKRLRPGAQLPLDATRVAICHNPAIRPLYRRLRAKGKRGDVAFGQCMRKLLHLVFAVWKTNRPFDPNHYPWQNPNDPAPQEAAASGIGAADSGNSKAEGHKDKPADKVVTSADSTIEQAPSSVKPEHPPAAARPHVDYAYLR